MEGLRYILNDFLELVYPRLCVACTRKLIRQETDICLQCQHELPQTDYHLWPENPVAKHFWGRVNITAAAALFHFSKTGRIQHVLHMFKYKGQKEIGQRLGNFYGKQLLQHPLFMSVDVIVPVPLHPKKEFQRGYNQSAVFGRGLAEAMEKPLEPHALKRIQATQTQTKKSRIDRWKNVDEVFEVAKPEALKNRHVLLVDDVITTGATMEACASAMSSLGGTTISIAAIAAASTF